ncbi:hypothetical protein PVL30_004622 [Lodderomyces elongisporus]|uniref:uncharacterized protein n=1 Tax=Lodderomyces elongisporus TaxID=36914 RepID=UPI00292110FE|nr:uncharacterized protein PVL30_004622 [Lodderomyces elongisporus]WLF80832.1 hypothetical protein PVL30_004622 [Lodderomyces elongisporus]
MYEKGYSHKITNNVLSELSNRAQQLTYLTKSSASSASTSSASSSPNKNYADQVTRRRNKRYSGIHMTKFKQMDSINSHYSVHKTPSPQKQQNEKEDANTTMMSSTKRRRTLNANNEIVAIPMLHTMAESFSYTDQENRLEFSRKVSPNKISPSKGSFNLHSMLRQTTEDGSPNKENIAPPTLPPNMKNKPKLNKRPSSLQLAGVIPHSTSQEQSSPIKAKPPSLSQYSTLSKKPSIPQLQKKTSIPQLQKKPGFPTLQRKSSIPQLNKKPSISQISSKDDSYNNNNNKSMVSPAQFQFQTQISSNTNTNTNTNLHYSKFGSKPSISHSDHTSHKVANNLPAPSGSMNPPTLYQKITPSSNTASTQPGLARISPSKSFSTFKSTSSTKQRFASSEIPRNSSTRSMHTPIAGGECRSISSGASLVSSTNGSCANHQQPAMTKSKSVTIPQPFSLYYKPTVSSSQKSLNKFQRFKERFN